MKYKVDDRVRVKSLDSLREIIKYENDDFLNKYAGKTFTIGGIVNGVYCTEESLPIWTDEMIEGLVEEEVSYDTESEWLKHEISLPEGYIFKDENGNIINATKIVLEKKKKEYPKTYAECCDILEDIADCSLSCFACGLLNNLQMLILCRDAYWKIAGEEMGLGKPWEPDWTKNERIYTIESKLNYIYRSTSWVDSCVLAFPTYEMRDAFYENFKELIKQCKELL